MTVVHHMALVSEKLAEFFWETEQKIAWGVSNVFHKPPHLRWGILPPKRSVISVPNHGDELFLFLCFDHRHMILFPVTLSLNCPCYLPVLAPNLIPEYCTSLSGLVTGLPFRKKYFNTFIHKKFMKIINYNFTNLRNLSILWKDKKILINKPKKTDSNTRSRVI